MQEFSRRYQVYISYRTEKETLKKKKGTKKTRFLDARMTI